MAGGADVASIVRIERIDHSLLAQAHHATASIVGQRSSEGANILWLWHGSRGNDASILAEGLKPEYGMCICWGGGWRLCSAAALLGRDNRTAHITTKLANAREGTLRPFLDKHLRCSQQHICVHVHVHVALDPGNVKPFGVWLHYRASYSARGFASPHSDGTKSVMLVRTATGTHGQDDGTGRRARKVAGSKCGASSSSSELADCHVFSLDDYRRDGRLVVYNGSQCMPGYVAYFT